MTLPVLRRLVGLMAAIVVGSALHLPLSADAVDVLCKDVHATAESTVISCSESLLGLCTAGQVTGNGLLKGTTLFVTTALGSGADPDDATVASDAGIWTLTTGHGTLTSSSIGMLDLANQLFFDVGRISGGTGRFEGATGTIYFFGTFAGTFPNLTFTTQIRAEVCLLRP